MSKRKYTSGSKHARVEDRSLYENWAAKRRALLVLLLCAMLVTILWFWRVRSTDSLPGSPMLETVPATTPLNQPGKPSGRSIGRNVADGSSMQLVSARIKAESQQLEQTLDPRNDGWESEAFSDVAQRLLTDLVEMLARPDTIVGEQFLALLADGFSCQSLRPDGLEEIYRDQSVIVLRPGRSAVEIPPVLFYGTSGLADALLALAAPLQNALELHFKIKTIRVNLTDDLASTIHLVETGGQIDRGTISQFAKWQCHWQIREGQPPRLVAIELLDYEEVVGYAPRRTWLSDCTQAVLGKNSAFHDQLRFGMNHWLQRVQTLHDMMLFVKCGLAVADVNSDGLDDVYVCQPGGLPNRLFLQNEDGTATDHSQRFGLDWLDLTLSALFVDLDNDGDQDLALTIPFFVKLLENDSSGKFRLRASLPIIDTDLQGLSAVDYDCDGDLDLYLCVDHARKGARKNEPRQAFIHHDANDGGSNYLFRNDRSSASEAKWEFVDVTEEVGLGVHNRRHSLAAAWEDYDNDGDQDLYVANDFGRNCLYRNDGGRFVDVASEASVVDIGGGMSVSWADYDRDGWMDLYVGNMFSSAGSRITHQEKFKPGTESEVLDLYQRFTKGNTLFRNLGGGKFEELGAEANVEMGRWAWSSVFVDLNNDSREDLVVANGFITTEDTGDL